MGLVSLAGPAVNFCMALITCVFLVIFKNKIEHPENIFQLWLYSSMQALYVVNIGLCAFNLFPILPLDGGRIVASILPQQISQQYEQTERYGTIILLLLLFVLPAIGLDILRDYMVWMIQGLSNMITVILKGVL